VRVERFDISASTEPVGRLAARIRSLAPPAEDVTDVVAEVVAAVRERGDAAVRELSERYDAGGAPSDLRAPPQWIRQGFQSMSDEVRYAIKCAADNLRATALAEAVARNPVSVTLPEGHRFELVEQPVVAAGIYVPGGRAAYPSTVLMACFYARVAGVERLVVATPAAADGRPHPAVLGACFVCGVQEVYVMGGAQAIAALAFGTETIAAVDVVVGPGSHWVQEAKRQVAGQVGIDGVAGPSEVLVVADATANAQQVALDLSAQGEHGPDSLLVLASTDATLVDEVAEAAERIAAENESVADAPLALVHCADTAQAVALANALAPEHLELHCEGAEALAGEVHASGAVFIGGGAAFGDYVAGSNHILPTGGAARFGAPLGVSSFRRRHALVTLPAEAAAALAPHAAALARAEGFPVHAESTEQRAASPAREGAAE
jgi:histidinol dehydrogenase